MSLAARLQKTHRAKPRNHCSKRRSSLMMLRRKYAECLTLRDKTGHAVCGLSALSTQLESCVYLPLRQGANPYLVESRAMMEEDSPKTGAACLEACTGLPRHVSLEKSLVPALSAG